MVFLCRKLPVSMPQFLPAWLQRIFQRAPAPQAGKKNHLLGKFAVGLGLLKSIDKYLPKPGSGAGYGPSEYISPLLSMRNGGGRSLEDLRQIGKDEGLREILLLERMPCGQFEANAVFFRIGVVTYNTWKLFTLKSLDESWHRHQVQTIR